MIPVLGIPIINRPDLLGACVASIDHPVAHLVIIDNSPDGDMADDLDPPACVERMTVSVMPGNLGYPASVNLVVKTLPHLPWWCIGNADVTYGPGDLARLDAEMAQGGARWVGIVDWRTFGLSAEAVDAVGFWDENYYPAYVEDVDYERRCDLAGVPRYFVPGTTTHLSSAAIRSDHEYHERNATRSYPANVAYHQAKWGGGVRSGERHATPFGAPGSLASWTLDRRRLADNRW